MFIDFKLDGEKGVQQENNLFRGFCETSMFGVWIILIGILDSTSCLVEQTCACI